MKIIPLRGVWTAEEEAELRRLRSECDRLGKLYHDAQTKLRVQNDKKAQRKVDIDAPKWRAFAAKALELRGKLVRSQVEYLEEMLRTGEGWIVDQRFGHIDWDEFKDYYKRLAATKPEFYEKHYLRRNQVLNGIWNRLHRVWTPFEEGSPAVELEEYRLKARAKADKDYAEVRERLGLKKSQEENEREAMYGFRDAPEIPTIFDGMSRGKGLVRRA